MTEEEKNRINELVSEFNSLVNEKNRVVNRYNSLVADLNVCQADLITAEEEVDHLSGVVKPPIEKIIPPLANEVGVVKDVFNILEEVKEDYLLMKKSSQASKTLTSLYEKYYTKFKEYNKLRQVTMGYVIGVDRNIWNSDVPRKVVEKTYLANTNYWLSYAIMSVVLWSKNEENAARRALSKSMQINPVKSGLFYLLINLRFERYDVAKLWYKVYLKHINENAIRDDFKYVLQILLGGSMGRDKIFEQECISGIKEMFIKVHDTNPLIDQQIKEEIMHYFNMFVSVTSKEYVHIRRNCKQYTQMLEELSAAEKNQVLLDYFNNILQKQVIMGDRISNKIEDSLHQLISDYDDEEKIILDKISYNELVVKARGNENVAKEAFDKLTDFDNKDKNIAMFMTDMVLDFDDNTPLIVRKFGLKYIEKYCGECVDEFTQSYQNTINRSEYDIEIDGWSCSCDEQGFETFKPSLIKHYKKIIKKQIKQDKAIGTSIKLAIVSALMTILFLGLASVAGLLAMGLSIGFICLAVLGGSIYSFFYQSKKIFMANQKIIDYGLDNFKQTLEEIKQWKDDFKKADSIKILLKQLFE